MNVVFLKELALGPTGKLICAKRDREGRIVLYLDAIALEYPDPQQGINTYLRCFREFNEDEHPRDEDGKWTDAGGGEGGGSSEEVSGVGDKAKTGLEHWRTWAKTEAERKNPKLQEAYSSFLEKSGHAAYEKASEAEKKKIEEWDNAFHAGSPEKFIAWAKSVDPKAFSDLKLEPFKPEFVKPVENLSALPDRLYHGSRGAAFVLTQGFSVGVASNIGNDTYAWKPPKGSEIINWSSYAWRWYQRLDSEGKKSLQNQLGHSIKRIDDLSDLSLIWTYDFPEGVHGETGTGEPGLVIDPHKISVFGWFEADEAARKGEVVLVCGPAPQSGPDAVVDVIEPKKISTKDWNEDDHPRDEDGKFTDAGGGDGGGDSETSGGGGTGEHPGKGYSAAAYVKNGVIHTSSVYDAQRALYENRKVELNQPRTLSVLIGRLGAEAKRMIAQGKSAPSFNLCNVTVSGTNLFCADTKGIPRVEMPQLDKQQTKDFRKYLEDQGYKVEKDKVRSSHLRATQNEINGAKVAATAAKLRAESGGDIEKRLIISRDNYILDGHHHWAAKVGLDAVDNKLDNDTKVKVTRVDISITKLLAEAEKFTGGKGHKPANEAKEFNEDEHPRDEDGKWTDAGGGDGGGSEGGTGTTEYPSGWLTERPSATEHPGISSDFDIRPQRPMPSQSGAVTVGGISSPSASVYRDVPITINPSVSVAKKITREAGEDGARALQDRAGNVVVWESSGALHADMMDTLAPMETMWASDIWTIEDGKIKSVMGSGTAMPASWLERGQTNAKNAEAASVGFVSPNVKSDLDFKGAVSELKSPQHAALMSASADIDRSLGLKAKETSIIGAWADGAENSIMATAGSDWDHVALATVMKGHLADQKSVLVFQQGKGDAALSHFRATGKLEEIHRNLLEDGLAFHTLVPEKDGAVVYVADLDGSLADAIEKGAARYDAILTTQFGRGEFIGDTRDDKDKGDDREQRDYARQVYEKNITESKVEGSAKVWSDIRDRWRQTAKEVKFFRRLVHDDCLAR